MTLADLVGLHALALLGFAVLGAVLGVVWCWLEEKEQRRKGMTLADYRRARQRR